MSRSPADPTQVRMSFGEHLEELRRRLIRALIGVGVAAIVTLYFGRTIVWWLCLPLAHAQRTAGLPAQTYNLSVTSGFSVYLKVSLAAAAILAAPWVVYQLWQFVAQGLYASERRVVMLLTPFSVAMVAAGVAFLYFVMLPICLIFFISFSVSYPSAGNETSGFMDNISQWIVSANEALMGGGGRTPLTTAPATQPTTQAAGTMLEHIPILSIDPAQPTPGQMWIKVPEGELRLYLHGDVRMVPLTAPSVLTPLIEINQYLGFVTIMAIGIVAAFQLPVVMLVAGWTRLVSPQMVARYRRHAVFACAVAAAVITPTGDPFSMAAMALPLWALFEIGLITMKLAYRPREEDQPQMNADERG